MDLSENLSPLTQYTPGLCTCVTYVIVLQVDVCNGCIDLQCLGHGLEHSFRSGRASNIQKSNHNSHVSGATCDFPHFPFSFKDTIPSHTIMSIISKGLVDVHPQPQVLLGVLSLPVCCRHYSLQGRLVNTGVPCAASSGSQTSMECSIVFFGCSCLDRLDIATCPQ